MPFTASRIRPASGPGVDSLTGVTTEQRVKVLSRVVKYCGVAAIIVGVLWFVTSCATSLSGDQCGAAKIRPDTVCVDSGGSKRTYEEMTAAKQRGPAQMAIGGTILAVGVGLSLTANALARRANP